MPVIMKVTVLIDNIGKDGLLSEWGLSFLIEYNGRRYLLDTGGSEQFIANASSLGVNLADVDCAVLSHAHYDHANGMEAFFRANDRALFHLSPDATDNCWSKSLFRRKYIGMPLGVAERFADRIVRPSGVTEIDNGVWIIPHAAPSPKCIGRRNHLYVKAGKRFIPDDFVHEQSLVFETKNGPVIFNSCSHSGPEAILKEVSDVFPGQAVYAYFGGLHLFRLKEKEVRKVAVSLKKTAQLNVFTGHCTGDTAFGILKEELGDRIEQFFSGMQVTL